jgi:hypothetical protein
MRFNWDNDLCFGGVGAGVRDHSLSGTKSKTLSNYVLTLCVLRIGSALMLRLLSTDFRPVLGSRKALQCREWAVFFPRRIRGV